MLSANHTPGLINIPVMRKDGKTRFVEIGATVACQRLSHSAVPNGKKVSACAWGQSDVNRLFVCTFKVVAEERRPVDIHFRLILRIDLNKEVLLDFRAVWRVS
jgi:hypothetical protein